MGRSLRWLVLLLLLLAPALAAATPGGFERPSRDKEQRRTERARVDRALRVLGASTALRVHWPPHRLRPASIRGLAVHVAAPTDAARARRFLEQHAELFALDGRSTLRELGTDGTRGLRVVRFQQLHAGIPIEGALVAVGLDDDGRVVSVTSELEPLTVAATRPAVAVRVAIAAALQAVLGRPATPAPAQEARLILLPVGGGAARLVYRVTLPLLTDPTGRAHLVDATTGAYLGWRPAMIVDALPARAPAEVRR